MKKILLLISLSILFVSCSDSIVSNTKNQDTTSLGSVHLTLGVPRDLDTTNDYIILRHQYALSYNKDLNVPNWVAYELTSDWFGDTPRHSGNFITDTTLPLGFYRVKHSDYTNSGYDRGHLVMSEQRTKTVEDNKATFILTSILPQCPDLNQGVWLDFENFCNDLARKENKRLFIYTGGKFSDSTIGKVAVPDSCFKIVVIYDGQVNSSTQIYSVMMPNIQGIRKDPWTKYQTTVRRIELSTGYDFLNNVSKQVQDIVEQ